MATRNRTIVRIALVGALAVTASLAVSAPASAGVQDPYCQGNYHWVANEERCVENAPVETPAPVDACPDEALNPGVQASGPCNVAPAEPTPAPAQPEEAFVDPAVDVDRGAGALAYGAATPHDGGASQEVAVQGAAAAPAVSGGGAAFSGELPYTGLTIADMAAIGIAFLLAGLGVNLHARRRKVAARA